VDASCIDPGVIELEERADRDGIIECFIGQPGSFGFVNIGLPNLGRVGRDFIDQMEQRTLGL